ncbi:uncharacterized protein [Panulirus ornatus]|uniref:uncharacterized protein n=1 Tax=Panulirus ornatus TaxID=150431 RepID=UPI003A8C3F56
MGPIRAFLRPSHGAAPGEFVTTASPFSPTQSFSHQHRPCCAHATPSLGPHHPYPQPHPHPHPHIYGQTCASDPLRVGLASSSQPCLYHHFKKLLPPGATTEDPHPGLTTQPRKRGASNDEEERRKDAEESDQWKKENQKSEWENSEYEWTKDTGESEWRKDSGGGKWKKSGHDIKWRRFSEEYKWKRERYDDKWKKDEYKWEKNKDNKWRKERKEFQWKKESDGLKCGKEVEDHKWKKDKDDNKWKRDRVTPLSYLSSLTKAEEPSSSRMALAFPFSDEEEDEDFGDDGRATGESKHETWPISDIVETEDEEGELQPEGTTLRDPSARTGQQCNQEDGALREADASAAQEHRSDDTPAAGAAVGGDTVTNQAPLAGAPEGGPGGLIAADASTHDPTPHHSIARNNSQDGCAPLLPQSQDPGREEPRGGGGTEEGGGRVDKEPEQEKKAEEGDTPRDGIRATQRLRPRSYRQFLLTRERRSRVFLKARSYHLGRWFVTHFTHPYPSKDQKDQLAARTNMTRNQVSEWFGNMRRRIREATRGMGVCWEERVRVYNSVITGKSEPLPILPGDAINTWVPPISQEPPVSENHEEVSVSPKFKTTLLQRYLNNSLEAPTRPSSDAKPPHSSISASPLEDEPHERYKSSSSSEPSAAFSQSLPLCTSSPKESFQALWNASFEHVKDDQVPCVTTRILGRSEHKVKLQNIREQGEEEGRPIKRYDRQRGQNYTSLSFKRQRTMEPSEDWTQQASTSRGSSASFLLGHREAPDGESSREQDSSTSYLHLTSWTTHTTPGDARSSDEEGALERCVRQPEELAAAYTLMQLQHM